MLKLPRFRAAAVQASPVYLNPGATADKAASLVREAAANGAKLVAFPEVFVPGYPYWNWITDPVTGSAWFEKLAKASVLVPGPEVDVVRKAARDTGCHVVLGVNERSPVSLGAIYNTLVFIGPDGAVLGKHRKLVPTWAEKLTWTGGDGSSLRVYDTEIGRLGGLACGENTNTLARFALLGQGELVHVASYISLPVAPPDYDMAEAIKLRAIAHSFEGKDFYDRLLLDRVGGDHHGDGNGRPRRACAPAAQVERVLRHHRTRWPRGRRSPDRRRGHRVRRHRSRPLHPTEADA
ncbi:putative amidohydrolase [Bradyrhizobium sp. i1.7.7]